jgi:hypothetical protein
MHFALLQKKITEIKNKLFCYIMFDIATNVMYITIIEAYKRAWRIL